MHTPMASRTRSRVSYEPQALRRLTWSANLLPPGEGRGERAVGESSFRDFGDPPNGGPHPQCRKPFHGGDAHLLWHCR